MCTRNRLGRHQIQAAPGAAGAAGHGAATTSTASASTVMDTWRDTEKMIVEIRIYPDESTMIRVRQKVEQYTPFTETKNKPKLNEVFSAFRLCIDESIDRAMELGFTET